MSAGASAAAIQYHYDLSDEFYKLWLDESLVYSCALWNDADDKDSLASAQLRKLDWHLQQARVREADSLLDIGCGWGALLSRAVNEYKARRAVGLTLSENQARFIERRGQSNVVTELVAWADHEPAEPYDAIVSIGAFEHFANHQQTPLEKLAGYRAFFAFCHRALRPGRYLSLQSITYENASKRSFSKFFAEEIFPESDLPHLSEIVRAAEHLFEVVQVRNDRLHYARTLQVWLERLRASRHLAELAVGSERVRVYEKYLTLARMGFHSGTMNLTRIAMKRIDSPATASLA